MFHNFVNTSMFYNKNNTKYYVKFLIEFIPIYLEIAIRNGNTTIYNGVSHISSFKKR